LPSHLPLRNLERHPRVSLARAETPQVMTVGVAERLSRIWRFVREA
jgi:hypothetical protein